MGPMDKDKTKNRRIVHYMYSDFSTATMYKSILKMHMHIYIEYATEHITCKTVTGVSTILILCCYNDHVCVCECSFN